MDSPLPGRSVATSGRTLASDFAISKVLADPAHPRRALDGHQHV